MDILKEVGAGAIDIRVFTMLVRLGEIREVWCSEKSEGVTVTDLVETEGALYDRLMRNRNAWVRINYEQTGVRRRFLFGAIAQRSDEIKPLEVSPGYIVVLLTAVQFAKIIGYDLISNVNLSAYLKFEGFERL